MTPTANIATVTLQDGRTLFAACRIRPRSSSSQASGTRRSVNAASWFPRTTTCSVRRHERCALVVHHLVEDRVQPAALPRACSIPAAAQDIWPHSRATDRRLTAKKPPAVSQTSPAHHGRVKAGSSIRLPPSSIRGRAQRDRR
jgi:hypothetical protein